MGLDHEVIQQLLRGQRRPTLEEERQLAEKLGDEVHPVLGDSDPSLHLLSMIDDNWAGLQTDAREGIAALFLVYLAKHNKAAGMR